MCWAAFVFNRLFFTLSANSTPHRSCLSFAPSILLHACKVAQIFIMPVFAMIVFLTVSQQTYTETAFFGASILISSSIIGITLNNNFSVLYVEIFRALGVLILIYLFGFADEALLPSIVMTLHALINLILSFGILFSYQRRLLIKPINN